VSYDNVAAARGRDGYVDVSSTVTRKDVFRYLTRNPGARAGQVAAGLDVGQGAVSEHLYRGRGRVFSSLDGGWYPIPAADPG
jgi:hypothetical protein